jgi:hypothetical protein
MQVFVRIPHKEKTITFCFDEPEDTIMTLKHAIENKYGEYFDWSWFRLMYKYNDLLKIDPFTKLDGLLEKEATVCMHIKMCGD